MLLFFKSNTLPLKAGTGFILMALGVHWLGMTDSCAFRSLSVFSWPPGCWKSMSLTLVTKAKQNSYQVAFTSLGWRCGSKKSKNRSCVTKITHAFGGTESCAGLLSGHSRCQYIHHSLPSHYSISVLEIIFFVGSFR